MYNNLEKKQKNKNFEYLFSFFQAKRMADAGIPLPSHWNRISYFHCSLLGYFLGLLTATVSSEFFKAAQPALLYLVPFTLFPLFLMAYLKGDLKSMWHEPFATSNYTKLPKCQEIWNDFFPPLHDSYRQIKYLYFTTDTNYLYSGGQMRIYKSCFQ